MLTDGSPFGILTTQEMRSDYALGSRRASWWLAWPRRGRVLEGPPFLLPAFAGNWRGLSLVVALTGGDVLPTGRWAVMASLDFSIPSSRFRIDQLIALCYHTETGGSNGSNTGPRS